MEKNQVLITKQDHFGNGITKIDGKLTFVEKALKDEVCEVEIDSCKKDYNRAHITNLLVRSIDRVNPPCPYYSVCGGCQLEHQTYRTSLVWKEEKVKELLARFANYHGPVEKIKETSDYGYRNKVTFKVKNRKLCFSKEKTNDLVEITQCLLLPSRMNELVQKINFYLKEGKEFLTIQIRMNQKEKFQIALEGSLDLEKFLSFVKDFSILSIYQNNHLVFGDDSYQDYIFGHSFYLSPKSFFQVNRNQIEVLYSLVLDEVKRIRPNKLLDLYCGVGTLGILASPYTDEVVGIEVVKDAIINANRNKEMNHISNITFYEAKVEDKIEELKEYDFWILDPPRKGLDSKTKEVLLSYLPKNVVYVSCDTVTLSRDLGGLSRAYEIKKVTPVDMFPQTYHVECVCVLNRR